METITVVGRLRHGDRWLNTLNFSLLILAHGRGILENVRKLASVVLVWQMFRSSLLSIKTQLSMLSHACHSRGAQHSLASCNLLVILIISAMNTTSIYIRNAWFLTLAINCLFEWPTRAQWCNRGMTDVWAPFITNINFGTCTYDVLQTSLNVVGEYRYRTIEINVIIRLNTGINMLTLFFKILLFGSSLCIWKGFKCIITAKDDKAKAVCCLCWAVWSRDL